jgi:hypothetical protein
VTITNKRRRQACAPSESCREVVSSGIKETYPEMDDSSVKKYLEGCSSSYWCIDIYEKPTGSHESVGFACFYCSAALFCMVNKVK